MKAVNMKIAIGAGHSPNCRGASGNGYDEHDEAVKCVNYFISLCNKHNVTVYNCFDASSNASTNLVNQVAKANAHNVDLAIQWHFNSFVLPTSNGTEVYYYKGSEAGAKYARLAQDAIFKSLTTKSRGIKTNSLYWTTNTNAPAILIETCFISNKKNMEKYSKYWKKMVQDVFTALTGIEAGSTYIKWTGSKFVNDTGTEVKVDPFILSE